ncbi:MAG: ABC transporter substrate-binding protein, partial [Ruthenibacterium sp.]
NKMQKPYYTSAYPINARFTTEESERGNVIENDLYSYVVLMTTKFIVGEQDVESGFDAYLETLEKTGLSELLTIKETALQRWNAAQ